MFITFSESATVGSGVGVKRGVGVKVGLGVGVIVAVGVMVGPGGGRVGAGVGVMDGVMVGDGDGVEVAVLLGVAEGVDVLVTYLVTTTDSVRTVGLAVGVGDGLGDGVGDGLGVALEAGLAAVGEAIETVVGVGLAPQPASMFKITSKHEAAGNMVRSIPGLLAACLLLCTGLSGLRFEKNGSLGFMCAAFTFRCKSYQRWSPRDLHSRSARLSRQAS